MNTGSQLRKRICQSGSAHFLHLTLDRPQALNALNLELIQDLSRALAQAEASPDIEWILLDSSSERAFCAGGDVRALALSLLQANPKNSGEKICDDYFFAEFILDYQLQACQKPLVTWSKGICFGGGIGLFRAGSLRVCEASSTFAMPEISIGYFPDVGASWFLRQFKSPNFGRFLGLTGQRISAPLALAQGLATHLVSAAAKENFLSAAKKIPSGLSKTQLVENLKILLAENCTDSATPEDLDPDVDRLLARLYQKNEFSDFWAELLALQKESLWFREQSQLLFQGSPFSARLIFAQLHPQFDSLAQKELVAREWNIAANFARHPDFREGVRALLIDKDRKPRWQNHSPLEIEAEAIKAFFYPPRGVLKNPLAEALSLL